MTTTITVLADRGQLASLRPSFRRAIGDEFDLAGLAGRLCPVTLEDDTAAIFVAADFALADQVDEIERMVQDRGYRLATPSRYILPAALLLALARGQLTAPFLTEGSGRADETRQSALSSIFRDLVAWGVRHGASDLHLNVRTGAAESFVRYTIDGHYLGRDESDRMPTATMLDLLAVAWMGVRGGNGAIFDPGAEQQGRIRLQIDQTPILLRWASLATDAGPSVCLRILRLSADPHAGDLRQLGYLPLQVAALRQACGQAGGAIVIAGRVGSGKSTTIAALMRGIPPTRKVITLEDPVEYLISNALQNTINYDLLDERDTILDAKLKTLKRSAMNDLLIGEIRDRVMGRAFMDLTGSGINVYTTVHAGAAHAIAKRLSSDFIGVSPDFLATPGMVKLLVHQMLAPRLCGHCALPLVDCPDGVAAIGADAHLRIQPPWFQGWAARFMNDRQGLGNAWRVQNSDGCEHCSRRGLAQLHGLAGRTVIAEMIDPSVGPDCLPGNDAGDRSAFQIALRKASYGDIDPRWVASQFAAGEFDPTPSMSHPADGAR